MNSLKKKTFKAFSFDVLNRLARQGISFVLSIFLARLLEPKDFGLLAMVNVIIAMASSFNDLGLGGALIQRQELKEEHYGSVFYFNMGAGLILTSILFFLAAPIASFYNQPEVKQLLRVMSLSFIISSFCNVRRTWLRKNLSYSVITYASVSSLIIGGTTGVIMAYKGYGVWSLVGQTLASTIVDNLVIYFFTSWKPKLFFRIQALKELWTYGIFMFLSALLDRIFSQLDNLIIGKLFTPITLGFYFRAKTLNSFINDYSSGSLMSVLFPVLSSVQQDKERYRKIAYNAFHLLNLSAFFLLGLFFLCAKDIIAILFSEKWLPAVKYYQIMVIGGFAYPLSVLLVNIISSLGNSKAFFRLELIKKCILSINFLIGFHFGIEVFLYGMWFVAIIALSLNIYFAAMEMRISKKWFYSIIAKYFISTFILLSGFNYLNNHYFISNYFVHGIVFALTFSFLYFLTMKIIKAEGYSLIKIELMKILENKNIFFKRKSNL